MSNESFTREEDTSAWKLVSWIWVKAGGITVQSEGNSHETYNLGEECAREKETLQAENDYLQLERDNLLEIIKNLQLEVEKWK